MKKIEDYHKTQAFEHSLINRRITWLLTSQGIFFAALGFVLGKDGDPNHKTNFTVILSFIYDKFQVIKLLLLKSWEL